MSNFELCLKCKINKSVWFYMPADSDHSYCDECVPRGCSCNIDPETEQEDRDEQGRLFPCCEYSFEPDGRSLP